MRPPLPIRAGARGFSLVELMVALLVMAIVLVGVYSTFFRSQNRSAMVSRTAEQRQHARAAMQLLERETRMAGSGWGRLTIRGWNSGANWNLDGVNPAPDTSTTAAAGDSVVLVGAWQAATTLTADMALATTDAQVASSAGFAAGDLFIVTDGTAAFLFQVTAVTSGPARLEHGNTSTYNFTAGTPSGWPSGGFVIGSRVYKATITTYKMDRSSYKRASLVRREFGQLPQVVAYNVDGFRVWYLMQGGVWTRDPGVGNLAFIDQIAPVVLTKVSDPQLGVMEDSVWTTIRPRTF